MAPMNVNDIPQLLAALIAVIGLKKDWKAHGSHTQRVLLVSAIVLLMGFSVWNNHRTSKQHGKEVEKADKQHDEDLYEIRKLRTRVEDANKAQADNTKVYLDKFQNMSQQLGDLKTQIQTQDLRSRATRLQAQLDANIRVMAEKPKIVPAFSFYPAEPHLTPVREITVLSSNNIVHLRLALINKTRTDSGKGFATVVICVRCKYTKSPPDGYRKIEGARDTEINTDFDNLSPETVFALEPIDIEIESTVSSFEIGIKYRCQNCIVRQPEERPADNLVVHVKRDFQKQFAPNPSAPIGKSSGS